jgi:hypothetical protein
LDRERRGFGYISVRSAEPGVAGTFQPHLTSSLGERSGHEGGTLTIQMEGLRDGMCTREHHSSL